MNNYVQELLNKLLQPQGYFENLYSIHSKQTHEKYLVYNCFINEDKFNNNNNENTSNKQSARINQQEFLHNNRIFLERMLLLINLIENNSILVENIWLEEINDDNISSSNKNRVVDTINEIEIHNLAEEKDSNGVYYLFISEYTDETYDRDFNIKSLYDYFNEKRYHLNDSMMLILKSTDKEGLFKLFVDDMLENNNNKLSDINGEEGDNQDIIKCYSLFILKLVFEEIRKYYYDVVVILQSLLRIISEIHRNGYQHMNLNINNVFINKEKQVFISKLKLPYYFEYEEKQHIESFYSDFSIIPPEILINNGEYNLFNYEFFDSWSIGIIILEAFQMKNITEYISKDCLEYTLDSIYKQFSISKIDYSEKINSKNTNINFHFNKLTQNRAIDPNNLDSYTIKLDSVPFLELKIMIAGCLKLNYNNRLCIEELIQLNDSAINTIRNMNVVNSFIEKKENSILNSLFLKIYKAVYLKMNIISEKKEEKINMKETMTNDTTSRSTNKSNTIITTLFNNYTKNKNNIEHLRNRPNNDAQSSAKDSFYKIEDTNTSGLNCNSNSKLDKSESKSTNRIKDKLNDLMRTFDTKIINAPVSRINYSHLETDISKISTIDNKGELKSDKATRDAIYSNIKNKLNLLRSQKDKEKNNSYHRKVFLEHKSKQNDNKTTKDNKAESSDNQIKLAESVNINTFSFDNKNYLKKKVIEQQNDKSSESIEYSYNNTNNNNEINTKTNSDNNPLKSHLEDGFLKESLREQQLASEIKELKETIKSSSSNCIPSKYKDLENNVKQSDLKSILESKISQFKENIEIMTKLEKGEIDDFKHYLKHNTLKEEKKIIDKAEDKKLSNINDPDKKHVIKEEKIINRKRFDEAYMNERINSLLGKTSNNLNKNINTSLMKDESEIENNEDNNVRKTENRNILKHSTRSSITTDTKIEKNAIKDKIIIKSADVEDIKLSNANNEKFSFCNLNSELDDLSQLLNKMSNYNS